MNDMYMHGWKIYPGTPAPPGIPPMPTGMEENKRWVESRSGYFKFRFLGRVFEMRNEYAQLHIQDEELDTYLQSIVDSQKMRDSMPPDRRKDFPEMPILPMEIESISDRLKVLASQIRSE
jgi:hypothetical protein